MEEVVEGLIEEILDELTLTPEEREAKRANKELQQKVADRKRKIDKLNNPVKYFLKTYSNNMNVTVDTEKAFGHVKETKEVASKAKTTDTKDNSVVVDLRNMVEANIARINTAVEEMETVYKVKPSNELHNSIIVLREAYNELKRVKIRA